MEGNRAMVRVLVVVALMAASFVLVSSPAKADVCTPPITLLGEEVPGECVNTPPIPNLTPPTIYEENGSIVISYGCCYRFCYFGIGDQCYLIHESNG